jgi:hypothetical protein
MKRLFFLLLVIITLAPTVESYATPSAPGWKKASFNYKKQSKKKKRTVFFQNMFGNSCKK